MNGAQSELDLGLVTPPPIVLRDYQEAALQAIASAAQAGVRRQLLVLPTGAGKTVVFSHLAYRMGCRTLVLAHRDELINQAVEKLRHTLGAGASIGVVKADRNETGANVIVGSIQTVCLPRRLAQLPKDLGLVVVDEAHHAIADSYRRALTGLGCFAADGPLLLGVTATPDRGDGKLIGNTIFQAQVFSLTMLDLMRQGHLCDVAARRVVLTMNLRAVKRTGGDLDPEDLSNHMIRAGAIPHIVDAYRKYGEGRKALVFTPTVRMAHEIAREACEAGYSAEAVDGTTPEGDRRAILRRLATGQTMLVANCAVLTEGFDEPSVSCLIMARPTQSRPLFVQMLGRGMRTFPGKDNCLVLDVVGNAGNHDVVSVPDVFGIPDTDGGIESVTTAVAPPTAPPGTAQAGLIQAGGGEATTAHTVDLFATRGPAGATFGVHWVPVEAGGVHYDVLNLGGGLLKLGQTATGAWCVVHNAPHLRPTVVHRSADAASARSAAVRYAHAHGQAWAFKAGLRWRHNPLSAKTREYAARLGITLAPACTAGQASDIILAYHAVRSYEGAGGPPRGANV